MEVGFVRIKSKCFETFRKASSRDKLLLGLLAFILLVVLVITAVSITYFLVTQEYIWGVVSHVNTFLSIIGTRLINSRLRAVRKKTASQASIENIEQGSATERDPEPKSEDPPVELTEEIESPPIKQKPEGDTPQQSSSSSPGGSGGSTQDEMISASLPSDPSSQSAKLAQSKSEPLSIQKQQIQVPRSRSESQSITIGPRQEIIKEALPPSVQTQKQREEISSESVTPRSTPSESQEQSATTSESTNPLPPSQEFVSSGSSLTTVTPFEDPLAMYLSSGSSLSPSTSESPPSDEQITGKPK